MIVSTQYSNSRRDHSRHNESVERKSFYMQPCKYIQQRYIFIILKTFFWISMAKRKRKKELIINLLKDNATKAHKFLSFFFFSTKRTDISFYITRSARGTELIAFREETWRTAADVSANERHCNHFDRVHFLIESTRKMFAIFFCFFLFSWLYFYDI